jgi:hypothetical protein
LRRECGGAGHPGARTSDALIYEVGAIITPLTEVEAIDGDRFIRRFYQHFKRERAAFLELVTGISNAADREWYAALLLHRLMFLYFLQKKGLLDSNTAYLRDRVARVQQQTKLGRYRTFYRSFLLPLLHQALSRPPQQRALPTEVLELLGNVPYLSAGLFGVHELECRHEGIDIPDEAFTRLFDIFDQYDWHLDSRQVHSDRDMGPDILGYVFEKHINQKQMGAYYTKEDVTEYISKNTIIPYLFDAARKQCPAAFEPGSPLWRRLAYRPDRYLYPSLAPRCPRCPGRGHSPAPGHSGRHRQRPTARWLEPPGCRRVRPAD